MKMLTVAVFVCVVFLSHGANIIVIPTHVASHLIYMSQLAADLEADHHNVSILLPSNAKTPESVSGSGVDVMTFHSPGKTSAMNSEEFSKHLIKLAFSKSFLETISIFSEMNEMGLHQMEVDCDGRFQLMSEIRTKGFDFAIVDGQDAFCGPLIPYALDLPFAFMSVSMVPLEFRVPALPSFSPMQMTSYSDRMDFWQRTTNLLGSILMSLAPNSSLHFVEKFVPEKLPVEPFAFFQKASLWFLMDDLAIGYAYPLMPNVIPIADVMARPSKILPEDIQLFLDGASKGAIFLSLGSVLNHVPEYIIDIFCSAFSEIEQRVVWRLPDNKGCSGMFPQNIMTSSWFPQNDILGHCNLKLFITHAGLNSIIESIYHTVPMIAIPISLDQPGNAVSLSDKQLGVQMNIVDFTAEELVGNIRQVLNNDSYYQAVNHASVILRKRQDTPGKRASFWIKHVLELGDTHLRTAAYDLNIWQFLMFDLFAFLLVVALVCVCCVVKVGCFICKCCCSRHRRKSKVD